MKALHQGAVISILSRGVDLHKGRSMPALHPRGSDSRLADKRPPRANKGNNLYRDRSGSVSIGIPRCGCLCVRVAQAEERARFSDA